MKPFEADTARQFTVDGIKIRIEYVTADPQGGSWGIWRFDAEKAGAFPLTSRVANADTVGNFSLIHFADALDSFINALYGRYVTKHTARMIDIKIVNLTCRFREQLYA